MDPMLITFVVLIVAIVLYATEKIPLAATSILVVIALSVTGVLSASEALSGFSNTTVVLLPAFSCWAARWNAPASPSASDTRSIVLRTTSAPSSP